MVQRASAIQVGKDALCMGFGHPQYFLAENLLANKIRNLYFASA